MSAFFSFPFICVILTKFDYRQGFSLLLYGLGSKVELIDDFQTQMLADYHILSVKGFFPGLTMKKVT